MPEEFLLCPRCNCRNFYARGSSGQMTFFQVNSGFWPIVTGVNASDLCKADLSPIHCPGCSWSGEIRDLKAAG